MPLTIQNKESLFKGHFIELWSTKFLDKNGREQAWEWVGKNDAVIVFPITKEGNIVLIKNFRVPLGRFVLETPAGLLDKENENNENAIRRELFEETGYTAEHFIPLPPVPYAAGISNNLSHFFIATGATKVADIHGDATEDITVIEIPAHELVDYYLNHPDNLFMLTIIGLYHIAQTKGLLPQT